MSLPAMDSEPSLHNSEFLQTVVADTAENTGRDFFRSLARSLAKVMQVRYCMVTECLDTPPSRVRTLAFWAGDQYLPDFEYQLLATPCEKVVAGQSCIYGKEIQALFSEDEDLVTLGAESYVGTPLLDSEQQTIGHLAILDDKPLDSNTIDFTLLDLFAARAAAEVTRLQAIVKLADSEARLRQVIDLVPHFIFAKDQEGRFILANQAVAETFGTSVKNLIGKTDADFSASAEEVEQFRRDGLSVLKTGRRKSTEETITDSEGRTRHLQTMKIPFTTADSESPAVLGVAVDVTDWRRLQRRLHSLLEGIGGAVGEAFLRSLVRHLAEALGTRFAVVAELDGEQVHSRAVWAGDGFAAGLDYPLPGSPCHKVVSLRTAVCYESGLQDLFPMSELMGQLGTESYLGTPLLDTSGEPIGILAVLDTRPMQAEPEDRDLLTIFASRAAAELQRERIEKQRQRLQDQLLHVQKLESLGVLAGGIAHDFNNLLSAIMGNTGLAQASVGADSSVAGFLRGIETAAQRSAELVGQMLAYSGKGRFVVAPVDLNSLIEDLLPLLSTSISKKASLKLGLEADLKPLRGDATQIRQVVMNLVINASDAIGTSSGTIRLTTGMRAFDRSFLSQTYLDEIPEPGIYLFLEVHDDGCGMTHQTLDRLFDPFFTTKTTGRGLGLAALLGIVRGHGGAVRVESEEGVGSSFTILFPLAEGLEKHTDSQGVAEASAVQRPVKEGYLLFVDDEELVRAVGRSALEKAGYQVLLAENGRRAVEIFQQRHEEIVAVILDMMMPELDGVETLAELRRLRPSIKGLLSSGYSDHASVGSMEAHGFHGFLQKPYRPEQLVGCVDEMLDG